MTKRNSTNTTKLPSDARKELILVTPELAAELLAKSIGNRRIMKLQVDRLVREIKAGRWNPEASEIRVSIADKLIDGHHRLTAIIRAGVAVWQWFAFGCREDTVHVIDTGTPRSISGQRTMLGEENAKRKTAVLNAVSLTVAKNYVVLSKLEQDDLAALVGDAVMDEAVSWALACANERFSSPSHVAGALAVLVRTRPEAAEFARRVVSASGEKGEPARELARWLTTTRGGGIAIREEIAQRVASAWEAHKAGSQRQFIRKATAPIDNLRAAARAEWARPFWELVTQSGEGR